MDWVNLFLKVVVLKELDVDKASRGLVQDRILQPDPEVDVPLEPIESIDCYEWVDEVARIGINVERIIAVGAGRERRIGVARRAKADANLTLAEYLALDRLMQQPGQTVSVPEIIEAVWQAHAPGKVNSLRVLLLKVRRKLASIGLDEQVVQTDSTLGYRFNPTLLVQRPKPGVNSRV